MVKHFTVAEPLLRTRCTLGEGVVWDPRRQRLYFVDIDQCRVWTYEPSSGIHGFQVFPCKVTSLSCLENGDGLIAAIDTGFAYIPFSSLPFPPTSALQSLIEIDVGSNLGSKEKRFNEGTVDPAGRFYAGTLGYEHGSTNGNMYSLQKDSNGHTASHVLGNITCTNGMGWSLDRKTMYFTDSWVGEIAAFDYDIESGTMSKRRLFSRLSAEDFGQPDGMCTDAEGGIWSARWGAGKVVRLTPDGELDVVIDLPTAWHVTCMVFGGTTMQDLYITTAASDYTGEDVPDRIHGGDVFVVRSLGYTGVERNRFKGGVLQQIP